MVIYDVGAGLQKTLPGARYKGVFTDNTEAEYNAIQWLDVRSKPAFSTVHAAALTVMRNRWRDKINGKTDDLIVNTFENSGVTFKLSREFQFDMLALDYKSALVTFPYTVKVNDDADGGGVYIELASAEVLSNLISLVFVHVQTQLAGGRYYKDSLKNMLRTELEEFVDPR